MTSIKNSAAWKNFSLYIKERDGWTCIVCGRKPKERRQCHAGHFIQSEGHSITALNEKNVNCECEQCNIYGDAETGYIYAKKLDMKWGAGTADYLFKLSRKIVPHATPQELKEISKIYLAKYRNLLAEKPQI